MKWLTSMLALYLLSLSLWPCADEVLPLTGQEQGTMLTVAITADSSSSHEHGHDGCTPFCTCACCATTITTLPRFIYSLAPSIEIVPVAVASFLYAPLNWADPLAAIWQPPKIQV